MRMSGPWGGSIDGIAEGKDMDMLIEDDILELNRAVKIDECGHDNIFNTTHCDLFSVKKEQHEGTNVIFYY